MTAPFDPIHTPLNGICLIEAAAGTGKTYAIEGLYLRLVLEAGLPVEEILVVTFTRAATAELRERIYRRLVTARDVLAGAPAGDDELLGHIAAGHPRPEAARQLLRTALADFDRAAIFTIHGFCQRVLHENAFETATPFGAEMLQDQERILTQVVEDFWRMQVAVAPPEFIRFARPALGTPGALLPLARAATRAEVAVTPFAAGPGLNDHTCDDFRRRVRDLRALWPDAKEACRDILLAAGLNGTVYGGATRKGEEGPSGRERRLQGFFDQLDAYTVGALPDYPPVPPVERLAAATLARYTLARRHPPAHPVFDACEALHRAKETLEREMGAQLIHLKSRLLAFVPAELERRKTEKGLVSFDDLLRRVDRALEGRAGAGLATVVRRRYRAALVDEFQDTDELQYRVFSRLFGAPGRLLLMIGDPKQAIYGFRGADIFSYLRAARDAHARFTLTTNWRSTPGLVGAVNTLFSRVSAPFLFRDIEFIPGRSALPQPPRPTPALDVWHLEALRHRPDEKPLTQPQARQLIARAVTADIREKVGRGELAGRTGEIAVLVRTNQEARLMKAHLAGAGIPSVLYSTANVFDAPEALELLAVLKAVAEPQDPARLKSALASRLLGETAAGIAAGESLPGVWEERMRRHWGYLNLWNERGFMPMFRRLLAGEAVRERLMAFPDGERCLTNLLHLGELLHRAAGDNQLGVSGIVKWLASQLRPGAARSEENQLRLESDERAVKIVTIHRSKGLEYPVVYCPFTWSASEVENQDFFFHDPGADYRLTVDLSGERDTPNRRLARNEALAENLRMLYVALTRAREHCTLVWGRINTADTSALAYLLRTGDAAATDDTADWIAYLRAEFQKIGDAEWRQRLESLAAASDGTIRVRSLPEPPADNLPEARPAEEAPVGREFKGHLDASWGVTSYSALAAGGPGAADREDPPMPESAPLAPKGEGEGGLHDFPAGARAGLFFHALLETIDFTAPVSADVVARKLAEFAFDASWAAPVGAMIAELAALPLLAGEHPPRLSEICPERCVKEMEFYFPLNRVSPARLEEALAPVGPPPGGGGPAEEPPGLLTFAPTHGFLRGFIDLVCEHRGRYYLVDWKSNRLGPGIDDYRSERLHPAMRTHRYDLQIQLYSLALHQLLRQRVPGYAYERHFGGAIYIFLRGLKRTLGPACGIFAFRPERRAIDRLGKVLIPDYE